MVRAQMVIAWVVSLFIVVSGVAGCSGGRDSGGAEHPTVVRSAVFTNGDFESDAIGGVPSGWTVTTFLDPTNTGITDTRPSPQTLASLNLATGGTAETRVVGGTPAESVADPDLGTGATLRYPKYGVRAALVNYISAATNGSNRNVNQMAQSMVTTNADVDPADNKIHVRFAVAPVLQSGGHPYNQQPYYFVELDNVTKGTILYQDFNASAQDGVPWKIVPNAVGDIYYTDWQLVDISPGNAGLAVGDQVKLTVIGSGCSQGGHFGRIYVDGIGSSIPGIYTSATGPSAANAGSNITYTISYKNGGTASAAATQINMVIPTGTTYQSNSLPSACSGVTAGSTGTLTCSLGALAPGSSGSFTVTVNINLATTGIVTNGNYSIQATGVNALLGPKVLTTVTSGITYADVSITKTDGVAAVGWGQAVTYTVQASNAGPGAASSVTIADTLPAQLTGVTWTCAGAGGGTCTASGTGSLNTTASLPVGATVTYTLQGSIIAGTGTGSVTNTATATLGGGVVDPSTSNNSAVDTDSIGVLRQLTLTKTNANGGTVTSVPASISCGPGCSSANGSFVDGTSVVLSASPVSGSSFTGWGGACSGAGTASTCTLTITADTTVTAAFTPPPTITIMSGNNQGAAISTAFGTSLVVKVLDSSSAPIANATVVFTVPSSGASAALSSTSVMTNASGLATVTAAANATAGAYSIIAGLSGSTISATFSLWNYGAASTISIVSGNNQSATVGTAFASPLAIIVRDAASQPVPGVGVTFAAPATGARAALGSTSATTGANGQTSVTATAGTVAGSYSVTATATGVATAATFTLANTAGAAASITATSGGGQSTLISTAFAAPLVVTVRDSFSNVVSGATVTFTPPGAGASASFVIAGGTTNASGQVSVTPTANATVGSYTVAASVTGVVATASFALTNFGPLLLSPATASRAPRAGVTFSASGDPSATYVYAFATNLSGGTINAATGAYVAGSTGNVTDVVRVTDSMSRTATASVTVGPGVSISPSPTSAPPRGSKTFMASGGSGTGFTFALTTNGSGGSVVAATGVYTAGATGNTTDVVTVTDSLGNVATSTITVNAGLTLIPATPTTPPGGTVNFSTSGGSGTGYVYAITTNHSGGTVDSSGKYIAGTIGAVSDTVSVTDSLGNVASTTVTVTAGVSLVGSGGSTPPRGALTFMASGGSGAGFVFALATNASGATINTATGAYTAGATGSVTDSVKVTDSLGNVATANVSVGVGVSLSPASPAAPPRGTVNLVASGGSGTGFAFSLTTNASGATINVSTGLYTAGATGGSVDVARVVDSLGNSASVSISVGAGLGINPPTTSLPPRAAQTFAAVGGGGGGFSFALTTNGSGGTIDAATGAYVAGSTGSTTDVVTVTDSLGNTATATIHVGSGLVLTPPSLLLAPLGTRTFSVSGGSGSGYAFTLSAAPSGGSIGSATGLYAAGTVGSVTDTVMVTDSLGNTAAAPVVVTASLQPVLATVSLAPRASTTLAVSGGSGDVTYALTINGSGGTIDPSTGAYVAGPTGNSSDVITVIDSNGATTTISITIGPGVSMSPVTPSVAPSGPISFAASGGSGTGYVFSLTTNGSGGTIDPSTGAYHAGPAASVVDVVRVVDSLGNAATVSVSVGGALVVNPATPSIAPRVALALSAVGGSGTGYTFALTSNMSGGSIDTATGAYHAGSTPNVVDVVTVTDSLGNTAVATITIGGPVVIAPATSNVAPRATVTFTASGGTGAGYLFTVGTNNSGATVGAATGIYVAGATPAVTDTVTVTDAVGNSASATITIGAGLSISGPSTSTPPRGALALTASGGSGDFTFALTTNGSGASIVAATGAYTAGATPNTVDVIGVTDDLGNQASLTIMVGVGVSITPTSPSSAPGGMVTFVAAGGSGTGFTFALTTNGSGGTINAQTGAYVAGSTDDVVDVVSVTDSLGNNASAQIAIGAALSLNPPTSHLPPRGTVQLTASGGSGTGYTFAISSNVSGGSIDTQTGLYVAGPRPNVTDVVTVTDLLGKSATAQIIVGVGVSISPGAVTLAPAGTVQFQSAGGSGSGYRFAITTNGSSGTIDPDTGKYTVGSIGGTTDVITVADSLGNTATATVTIGPALTLTPDGQTLSPHATLQLVAAGGAAPYAFAISTNLSGGSINQTTGDYTAGQTSGVSDVATVVDANGVTRSVTIKIGLSLSITPADPTVGPKGTVAFTAAGGSGTGFTWRLSSNDAGGTIDTNTGKYTASATPPSGSTDIVEVTDSLGNLAHTTVHLKVAAVTASGGSRGCNCEVGAGGSGEQLLSSVLLALALMVARRRRSTRATRFQGGESATSRRS